MFLHRMLAAYINNNVSLSTLLSDEEKFFELLENTRLDERGDIMAIAEKLTQKGWQKGQQSIIE